MILDDLLEQHAYDVAWDLCEQDGICLPLDVVIHRFEVVGTTLQRQGRGRSGNWFWFGSTLDQSGRTRARSGRAPWARMRLAYSRY